MSRTRTARFWLVTLAAVVGIAATLALGRWQLSRAAQKEAIQAGIEDTGRLPPVDTAALAGAADPASLLNRRIVLRGEWVAADTVYLDNRQMHGTPGFYVVTPLRLEGGTGVVLVQRGWAQRNFIDRTSLPPVQTPAGTVQLEGRIAPAPGRLYEFKEAPPAGPSKGSSAIRQNLDLADFGAQAGLRLLGVTVVQAGAASEGLQRDWPVVTTGVEKHYGYAFQWFGLSALFAILYVWFQFIAPRRQARRA